MCLHNIAPVTHKTIDMETNKTFSWRNIILVTLIFVVGFFLGTQENGGTGTISTSSMDSQKEPVKTQLEYPLNQSRAFDLNKKTFLCRAITSTDIFEDQKKEDLVSYAIPGTDTAVISLEHELEYNNDWNYEGYILFATGADAVIGREDMGRFNIITDGPNARYAIGIWHSSTNTDLHTLVFDKVYGNLVWGKTGTHFLGGMRSESIYFTCK